MTTKRIPCPRDPLALAKLIGDNATGLVVDALEDGKDEAAVPFDLWGGLSGGIARAAILPPARRSDTVKRTS